MRLGLDNFGFVPQPVDQFGDVFDSDTSALRGGDFQMDELDPGSSGTPSSSAAMNSIGFFAGLDDARKRGVARFVEPQVGRDDGWQT